MLLQLSYTSQGYRKILFRKAKQIGRVSFSLIPENLNCLWPNLKNLSGGLNLSHGLNMVGPT